MILPRGVTGFWHIDDPALPSTDARQFRADLFDVARAIGAEVIHKPRRNPSVECNFYDAMVSAANPIRVLLNITYPFVAFSQDWESEGAPPSFLDHPDLAHAFQPMERYTVLSVQDLEAAVTNEVIQELAPAELDQLTYWKPSRVGDVIFNYWD